MLKVYSSLAYFVQMFRQLCVLPLCGQLRLFVILFCVYFSRRMFDVCDVFVGTVGQLMFLDFNIFGFILHSAIDVLYFSVYEFVVEEADLCECFSVSDALAFPSAALEHAFIHLVLENFATVIMFEAVFELSDILSSVGLQHSVAVDVVVQPLPHILHSVVIFHLVRLDFGEQMFLTLGERLVLIIWQRQLMVEREVEFLQFWSNFLNNRRDYLRRLRLLNDRGWVWKHYRSIGLAFLSDLEWRLQLADEGGLDSLLIDDMEYEVGKVLWLELLMFVADLRRSLQVGLVEYIVIFLYVFEILVAVAHANKLYLQEQHTPKTNSTGLTNTQQQATASYCTAY